MLKTIVTVRFMTFITVMKKFTLINSYFYHSKIKKRTLVPRIQFSKEHVLIKINQFTIIFIIRLQ